MELETQIRETRQEYREARRNLDPEALVLFSELENLYNQRSAGEQRDIEAAILRYERGALAKACGDLSKAAEYFDIAAKADEKSGVTDRAMFSEVHGHFCLYLLAQTSPEDTYEQLIEIDTRRKITPIIPGREAFFLDLEYVLMKKLYEVAFEFSGAQSREHITHFLRSPYMGVRGGKKEPYQILMSSQARARRYMINGQHTEAARIFAIYLDANPTLVQRLDVTRQDTVDFFANNQAEEVVWDYRDFGRSLLKSNLEDGETQAKIIWQRGLQFTGNRGAMFFTTDIQKELDALTQP